MLRLRCLNCGLTVMYQGSEADFCPRCLAREERAVQLIPVSDRPSSVSERSIGRLRIHSSIRGERHIVALNGELDVASAPVLEATLAEACDAGAKDVVLDMGCVEFIDSSGLNAILRGRALCERHGCGYSLTPAQRPAQRVFDETGVTERLRLDRAATDAPSAHARVASSRVPRRRLGFS